MNAIEVRNLYKSYKGFALKNIDFTLPEGSIMGLVGENGAGKSTTIKLLMDAIGRDSGTVKILGVDNQGPAFLPVKEDVGVVLDEAHFPETLNAKQLGRVMAGTYKNWDADTFEGYLTRMDLPRDRAIRKLSRGMKMKLALAAALSHHARLLILDEPTGGLDPMVRDEILDIFNDFTRDETHSVLISSHIVSDLEKICDYIAFIHKGELLLCEEKDRLLEEYALAKLSERDFEAVPEEAVHGVRRTKYGVEALVERALVNPAIPLEHTTLEDIIVFFAKGEQQ